MAIWFWASDNYSLFNKTRIAFLLRWWVPFVFVCRILMLPFRVIIYTNDMKIDEIKNYKEELYQIADKYGILKIFIFGSVARGESSEISDIDLLIEMKAGSSALNVGGFQYEVQQLLGIETDVIPTFVLSRIKDRNFVQNIQTEAVML